MWAFISNCIVCRYIFYILCFSFCVSIDLYCHIFKKWVQIFAVKSNFAHNSVGKPGTGTMILPDELQKNHRRINFEVGHFSWPMLKFCNNVFWTVLTKLRLLYLEKPTRIFCRKSLKRDPQFLTKFIYTESVFSTGESHIHISGATVTSAVWSHNNWNSMASPQSSCRSCWPK